MGLNDFWKKIDKIAHPLAEEKEFGKLVELVNETSNKYNFTKLSDNVLKFF